MKKKLSKKLSLGKRSIAILSDQSSASLRGGVYSPSTPGGVCGGTGTGGGGTGGGGGGGATVYPTASCTGCGGGGGGTLALCSNPCSAGLMCTSPNVCTSYPC